MHQLARAFFESATLFDHDRLPEVFAGHPGRRKHHSRGSIRKPTGRRLGPVEMQWRFWQTGVLRDS